MPYGLISQTPPPFNIRASALNPVQEGKGIHTKGININKQTTKQKNKHFSNPHEPPPKNGN